MTSTPKSASDHPTTWKFDLPVFHPADLAGLNLATRPTALVECANMRNPEEAALVSSEAGRDRYAAAIADGVQRFLDGR